MPVTELARWTIEYDPEATKAAFAQATRGSPESCGCRDCRNFVAVRQVAYPEQALALFAQLGINPMREAEVYYNGPLSSGLHSYGGWFHFAGTLLPSNKIASPAEEDTRRPNFQALTSHFQFAVSANTSLVPSVFRALPLLQLEFTTEIPWVLEESAVPKFIGA